MDKTNAIYIGIDPGVVNTGWCIRGHISGCSFLATGVFNPSEDGRDIIRSVDELVSEIYDGMWAQLPENFPSTLVTATPVYAAVERYVAYKGTLTSVAENTCLLIGSLTYLLRSKGIITYLTRAISWKTFVCKRLHLKEGFNNPSLKLDKKFSIAAAIHIAADGRKFKTNHEADAVGLSYFAEHQ